MGFVNFFWRSPADKSQTVWTSVFISCTLFGCIALFFVVKFSICFLWDSWPLSLSLPLGSVCLGVFPLCTAPTSYSIWHLWLFGSVTIWSSKFAVIQVGSAAFSHFLDSPTPPHPLILLDSLNLFDNLSMVTLSIERLNEEDIYQIYRVVIVGLFDYKVSLKMVVLCSHKLLFSLVDCLETCVFRWWRLWCYNLFSLP